MTVRLPVVGSSASSTSFVLAEIVGADGRKLYIDGNQKITRGNGSFEAPAPNAFSLVNVADCPQSTPTCRAACYIENIAVHQTTVYEAYQHNSRTIREILAASHGFGEYWAHEMAAWIRANAPGGFRWHVSGDVYSTEYAEWIADVCRAAPEVSFWIYTRSFDLLGPLMGVSTHMDGNLAINLSCDVDNFAEAVVARDTWDQGWFMTPDAQTVHRAGYAPRLAYLTVDGIVPDGLGPDDVIFPDYQLRPRQHATLAESPWWQSLTQFQRGLVCPVDAHSKAENRRCGPCARCLT